MRLRHRLVERRKVPDGELLADGLAPRLGHRGRHVDDDQAADARRPLCRERERVEAAQAHGDQRRRLPAEMVEEMADIAGEVVAAVACCPLGVAVSALVERDHVVVAGQVGRDLVEAVRRLRGPVEQEQRRPAARASLEAVEAQAAQNHREVAHRRHGAIA